MANRTRSRRIMRHAIRLLNGVGGFGVEAPYVSRTVLREYWKLRDQYIQQRSPK
jgi:hypothetical protein